jgi:hypothetical protein
MLLGSGNWTLRKDAMPECKIDNSEPNYPYDPATFALISHLSPFIKKYSARFAVPPIAVVGSIADEYNTQRGWKGWIDWIQDYVVISNLPSCTIELDYRAGTHSKFLNATRSDLGPANINLAIARQVYVQYQRLFPKALDSWAKLVDYLISDEGAVVVSAIVIRKGMDEMSGYLVGQTPEIREALLVTYFKQGRPYIARYKARLSQSPGAKLVPGEGCRVFNQRAKLTAALGL